MSISSSGPRSAFVAKLPSTIAIDVTRNARRDRRTTTAGQSR